MIKKRAREWNVAAAFAMIDNTIKWRDQNKPDQIQLEEVDKVIQTGDLYISSGRDLRGRVLVYMRPGKTPDSPEVRAQYIRHMAWVVENVLFLFIYLFFFYFFLLFYLFLCLFYVFFNLN